MSRIDEARQRAVDLLIRAKAANNLSQEANIYKQSIDYDLAVANNTTDLLEASDIQSSGPEGVAGSILHGLAQAGIPFVTGANSVQTGNANWNQIANNEQAAVMNKIAAGEKLTPQEQAIANQEIGGGTDPVKQVIGVLANPLNTAHMIGQSIGGMPTVAEATRQTKNFATIYNNAVKDAETNNWEGAPAYNKIDQRRLTQEYKRLKKDVKPGDDSTLGMLTNFKDLLGAAYQAANNERAGTTSTLLESAIYLLPGVGQAALAGDIGNFGLEASAKAKNGRVALTEEEQQRINLTNAAYGAAGIVGNKFAKAGLGLTKKAASKEGSNALVKLLSKDLQPKSAMGRAGLHIGGHGLVEGVEEGFQSAMEDYGATGQIDFSNVAFGTALGSIGGASMSLPGSIGAMGKGVIKKKTNKKDTQEVELDDSFDLSGIDDNELINLDSDNFNPTELVRRRFANLMDDTKTFTSEDISNNIKEIDDLRNSLIDEENTLTEKVKRHEELNNIITQLDEKINETRTDSTMQSSAPSLQQALLTQLEQSKQDAINELNSIGDIGSINNRLNKIMEHSDDLDLAIDDFKINAQLMDEYDSGIKYELKENDWDKTTQDNITESQQLLVNTVDKFKDTKGDDLVNKVAKELDISTDNAEDIVTLRKEVSKASKAIKENKVKPMKVSSLEGITTPEEKVSKILASPASYTTNQIENTLKQLPPDSPVALQLRSLIEERVLANVVKNKDDVSNQIIDGNKNIKVNKADRFVGLNQYNERFADAAKNKNEKTYNYHLRKLTNFAKSHRGKANAVRAAIESGKEGYVVKDGVNGNWVFVDELPKGKTRAQLGAVEIHQDGTTNALLDRIENEAKLIEATLKNRSDAKESIFGQSNQEETPPKKEHHPKVKEYLDKGYKITSERGNIINLVLKTTDDKGTTSHLVSINNDTGEITKEDTIFKAKQTTPPKKVDDSNLRTDDLLADIYTAIKELPATVVGIYSALIEKVIEGTNPNKMISAKDNNKVQKAISDYFGSDFVNKGQYVEDDVVFFNPDKVDISKSSLKSYFSFTEDPKDAKAFFLSNEIKKAMAAKALITMLPENARKSSDTNTKGNNRTDYKSYTDYLLANGYEEIQKDGKGTGVFRPVGSNRTASPRVSKPSTPSLNFTELDNIDFKNPTETLSKIIEAVKAIQTSIDNGEFKLGSLPGWIPKVMKHLGLDNNLSSEQKGKLQQVIAKVRDYLKQEAVADVTSMSDITLHSGGAYGADTLWDVIGRTFGITKANHYRAEDNKKLSKKLREANVTATILSKEEIDFARNKVNELLKANFQDNIVGNLQARNYYQVANSDGVYAIAPMHKNKQGVSGGTATAVKLGIAMGKPVYVWDTNTKQWYKHNGKTFEAVDTPILSKNPATVGTRDIELYDVRDKATGKYVPNPKYLGDDVATAAAEAIRAVFANTVSAINTSEFNIDEEQKLIDEGWELVREAKQANVKVYRKDNSFKYLKENKVTDATESQSKQELLLIKSKEDPDIKDNILEAFKEEFNKDIKDWTKDDFAKTGVRFYSSVDVDQSTGKPVKDVDVDAENAILRPLIQKIIEDGLSKNLSVDDIIQKINHIAGKDVGLKQVGVDTLIAYIKYQQLKKELGIGNTKVESQEEVTESISFDELTTEQQKAVESLKSLDGVTYNTEQESAFVVTNDANGITVSVNPGLIKDVPLEELLTLHSEPLLAQTTFATLLSLGFNTEQIEAVRDKILPNMVENILLSREIKDSKQPYNSPTNTQHIIDRAIITLNNLGVKGEKEFKPENFNMGKSELMEDYTIPSHIKTEKVGGLNKGVREANWIRGHVLPKLAPVTKAVKGFLQALKNSDFLKQRDTTFNKVSDYFERIIATKDLSILDDLSTEDKARVLPQLDAFIRFHNEYAPIIRKMVNNNSTYINDIIASRISGHLLHNGKIEEAVVTAVSIALFEAIKQNGHKVHGVSKDVKAFLGFKKDDYLSPTLRRKYSDAGTHQIALADSIGMNVINMLGITLNDQGNQSLVNELAQALGLMAIKAGVYTDGSRDALLHQNTYSLQEHLISLINETSVSFILPILESAGVIVKKEFPTKQDLIDAVVKKIPPKATFNSYRNNIQERIEDKEKVKYYSYPVLDILKSTEGGSIISKIWGLRTDRGEPLEEPIKEVYQDKIHNSTAEVPQQMKDKLVKANQRPHTVVANKADFVIKLFNKNKKFLLDILGQPRKVDLDRMHPAIREDKEANAAIYARDVADKIKWLENRRKVEGDYVSFFMNPVVWVNQRIGYLNTLFDPQTSIFARMLTSLDKAKTEIHPVNDALLEQDEQGRMIATQHGLFLRAIAEGMEGATKAIFEHVINTKFGTNYNAELLTVDKISSEHFMEIFQDYILNSEEVTQAVEAIIRINQDDEISPDDIQIVSNIVNKWDMAELSLGALLDIVEYRKAYEDNQSFTTEVLVSSDGVTNGPILTQLMMGIITPEKMLAGGLFTKEQGDVDYFQQKERGENDLYQQGGKQMLEHMDNIINEPKGGNIKSIVDTIKKVDKTFGLRKAAKVILTPFNYGAGTKRLKVAVTESFVEKLQSMYYDLYQHLGTPLYAEKTKAFNDIIIELANKHALVFSNTYSTNPVELNTQLAFDVLIVNATYGSDIAIYNKDGSVKSIEEVHKELEAYQKEQIKKGSRTKAPITLDGLKRALKGIKYSKFKPDVNKFIEAYTNNPDVEMDTNLLYYLAELVNYTTANIGAKAIDNAEQRQINARDMLNNLSNTAFNVYAQVRQSLIREYGANENELTKEQIAEVDKKMEKFMPLLLSANAIVDGANQDRGPSITSGLPLNDTTKVTSDNELKESFNLNGKNTSITAPFKFKALTEPGVRGLALAIQALDSFVSSTTLAVVNGLNTHDSNSFTLSEAREGIKQQNKNVLEAALKYDLGIEFFNALMRSLDAITGLSSNLIDSDKIIISGILTKSKLANTKAITDAYEEQVNASISKLQKLLTLGFIHQYAGEGGSYKLTPEDVSRIEKRIEELNATKENRIKKLTAKLDNVFKTLKVSETVETEEEVEAPKGPLSINDWMRYIYDNRKDANGKALMARGIGKKVIDIFIALGDKEALSKVTINQDTSMDANTIVFDRATNTIKHNISRAVLSNAIKTGDLNNPITQAVLKELTLAVLHNNFLFIKNSAVKFKGLKTHYDNIHRLSMNAVKIINKSNLTNAEKEWLTNYFETNKGNVESIVYDMYVADKEKVTLSDNTETTLNELLDKVMLPASNDSMLDKIVSFLTKIIDLVGLDTVSLKTLIRNDATRLLNNVGTLRKSHTIASLIKTSKEGSYKYLSPEFIEEEFSDLNYTFNSLVSNLYNRQGSKDKNGTPISLTAVGVLNELKRLMKETKDIPMEAIYSDVIAFLEAHGADAKVFIVDNISGLSEDLQYHLRKGDAVYDTVSGKVYIPAPSLATKSNIRTSSVLHELLHSVTYKMIKANGKGSKLETIYNQFRDNANRTIGSLDYAATSLDEFVSQVMTLQDVRDELTSLGITMEEFNNALAEVMKTDAGTVETISGIAALDNEVKKVDEFELVASKVTAKSTVEEIKNYVSQFSDSPGILMSKTKKDIIAYALFNMSYKQLKENGITLVDVKNKIPSSFSSLNSIVDKQFTDLDKGDGLLASPANYTNNEKVFSPSEIFTFLGTKTTNDNSHLNIVVATVVEPLMQLLPNDLIKGYSVGSVWKDALTRGTPIFVSEAFNNGFKFDDQQAYVMETVQVAIDKAFDSLADTPAYRVLKKSYIAAKKQITVEDFHKGNWNEATEDEKQLARDKWNFVFNTPLSSNPKSDYLSRFAALAVANDEFRDILNTVFDDKQETVNSISQKAMNTVVSIIDWIYDKDVKANKNDDLYNKVSDLMEQLADIYQKNLDEANEINSTILDSITDKVNGVSKFVEKKLSKTIKAILNSDIVRNNVLGRISEKLVRLEVKEIAEFINYAHHEMYPGHPQGFVKSLIDEVAGVDSKEVFQKAKQLFHNSKSIEQLREQVAEATASAVVNFFHKDNQKFSKEEMKAMSQLLRIDAQALLNNGYTYADIINLMENPSELTAEINKSERNVIAQNKSMSNEYLIRAKDLGQYLITRKSSNTMLAKNATAIYRSAGLPHYHENDNKDAIKEIDKLVTLYALRALPRSQKKVLSDLHTKETNLDSKGIEDTLKLHGEIARETNRVNFADNPLSFNKGYLPNDLNSSVGFEIISEDDIDDYERRGFIVASELKNAQMDKSNKKVLVINPATGQQRYVSGGLSLQQTVKSGNTVFEDRNPEDAAYIKEAQQEFMKLVAKTNYTRYSPRSDESFLIPSYDRMGNLISLSYEMTSYGLDKYLERDNDFAKLIGNYKGSTRANQQYPEVNRQMVDYLKDMYLNDEHPEYFVEISREAPTQKGRELWAMLPVELREYITNNGDTSMHIKPELVDMMFGYQKLNPGLAFKKEQELRNVAETIYTSMYEFMFGDLAEMKFNKHYANWISAIALMKEIIVVRTGGVLMANIMSNLSLLMLNKFDPKNAVSDIKTALRYGYEYQRDLARLNQLEAERVANPSGKLNAEYSVVKDALARNPLREFIEAGMMPGIVMDVEFIKSEFRSNSDFDKLLNDIENKLPDKALQVGRLLTVAKGTKLHNFMMNATQQSDFVFKYAVYQQEMRRGKTKEEAIRRARDFFIDYDIPTSQGMQFLNDIGIFMFSKFALRIQRVVATLARENPGGLIIESLLMSQVFGLPSVASLAIPARIISAENPLRIPLDDLASMYANPFPIAIFRDLIK